MDLTEPPETPKNCTFIKGNVLEITAEWVKNFNFVCASSPCEQFSVHGMPHFHKNPPYPELGIQLFNHTRAICESSGVPYVMENVRAAQRFVGKAEHHCGAYFLWGPGCPLLLPPRTRNKNINIGGGVYARAAKEGKVREARQTVPYYHTWSGSKARADATAGVATIPPELAHCVAEYAERILEQKRSA